MLIAAYASSTHYDTDHDTGSSKRHVGTDGKHLPGTTWNGPKPEGLGIRRIETEARDITHVSSLC
jgi:hypothetical protein